MANKVKAFRGLIFAHFNSEAEFARELGWSRQRLSKMSNGKLQPDLKDIDALSKALQTPPEKLMYIFLEQ